MGSISIKRGYVVTLTMDAGDLKSLYALHGALLVAGQEDMAKDLAEFLANQDGSDLGEAMTDFVDAVSKLKYESALAKAREGYEAALAKDQRAPSTNPNIPAPHPVPPSEYGYGQPATVEKITNIDDVLTPIDDYSVI